MISDDVIKLWVAIKQKYDKHAAAGDKIYSMY